MLASRTRAVALALALASIGATACGAGDAAEARDSYTVREIRQVHRAWLNRLAAGDASACELLTYEARLRLVDERYGACFMFVSQFASGLTDEQRAAFVRVGFRRVRVRRGRAEIHDRDRFVPAALVGVLADNGRPMVLRRVRGRWEIDWLG